MHLKKKRKLFVLYSIPINLLVNRFNLCKRKYLVSYSIPLSCMVVLLLGGVVAINPSLPLKSSAVTIQDEWVVKEKDDSSSDINNVSENDINGSANTLSDADAGISVASVVPTPTLAITVSNSNQTIDAVQGGNTVYGSYNVSLTGSNVKDYTLSIKADSVNLAAPSQASTATTVGGADGKTGNTMIANTWGYKLTETSTSESSYGTLNYASLPTSLQQITNGNVSSPYNLSMNKKLVFAAKFKDDAAPGTYKGHITLSAVANQAVVSAIWSNGLESGITDMQDISSGFCKNNSKIAEGDTIILKDSRDSNSYRVVKLRDGNCWMQENLRLKLTSGTTIEGSATDGAIYSWTIPSDSDNKNKSATTQAYAIKDTWTTDATVIMSRAGTTENGNYYTWCAATAGACASVTSAGAVAPASICPKSWYLPGGGTGGDFYTLFGADGSNLGSTSRTQFDAVIAPPYSFTAAGLVNNLGDISNVAVNGYYWSSAGEGGNYYDYFAEALSFGPNGGVSPVAGKNEHSRYFGFSVRCIARY